jgi:transglutaminase-like putative cysteine protease
MHIQIDSDSVGRYDLRWRGVALSNFDGHTWSKRSGDDYVLQRWPDNSFAVPKLENTSIPSPGNPNSGTQQLIHYRVLMEPIGTNVFFLAPWARAVSGPYRLLAADSGGAVYNFDVQGTITRYEAVSDIGTAAPEELRLAGRNYPPQITATYLRLPPLDPRIAQLGAQIAGVGGNDYDRAVAIEHHLRTQYRYTLQLPRSIPKDPIANFLFERKQGHCEYFASAMAVLLRTQGVPSRVVNGFRSDEFNDLTGNYVVRAKDAHSWVEVYFPGYGWHAFDPTPAGNAGTPQGWARISLYLDAMASFWRDWIVSYDASHQYALGQVAFSGTRSLWHGSRAWARMRYQSMLRWAQRSQDRVEHSPGRWAIIALGVVLVFLLVANIGKILRSLHEHWLRAHPGRSPEEAAAMWYSRMARTVARKGVQRSATQTPREFLEKIEDERLRVPVARFTEVYESARFGNSADDASLLPELYEEVETAARTR